PNPRSPFSWPLGTRSDSRRATSRPAVWGMGPRVRAGIRIGRTTLRAVVKQPTRTNRVAFAEAERRRSDALNGGSPIGPPLCTLDRPRLGLGRPEADLGTDGVGEFAIHPGR